MGYYCLGNTLGHFVVLIRQSLLIDKPENINWEIMQEVLFMHCRIMVCSLLDLQLGILNVSLVFYAMWFSKKIKNSGLTRAYYTAYHLHFYAMI